MTVVDAYRISPLDIKPGDEMLFVVKAMVRPGSGGKLVYRIYRCQWEGSPLDDVPQGSRVLNEQAVCEALFPSLAQVAEPDPW